MSAGVDILAAARRRWPSVLLAVATLVAWAGWWLSAPFRGTAFSQAPAGGIHKMQGAAWHPERGDLLFVAVIGSDARNGPPDAGGGCDAIHIVAINPQQRAGTILNFPRDSYLNGRKLTDICRQAGFDGAVGVLKSHTGLPVQYLVRTEFSHFMRVINDIGGIDVDVPFPMNDTNSGAVFPAGPRHMLGGEALAFSRNRHIGGGDFKRTEHQGLVLLSVLQKFRADTVNIHNMLTYLRAARRNIGFNIPLADLMKLGLLARDIDPANIKNVTIPGSTGNVGGASVVFVNPGDIYSRVRDDAIY